MSAISIIYICSSPECVVHLGTCVWHYVNNGNVNNKVKFILFLRVLSAKVDWILKLYNDKVFSYDQTQSVQIRNKTEKKMSGCWVVIQMTLVVSCISSIVIVLVLTDLYAESLVSYICTKRTLLQMPHHREPHVPETYNWHKNSQQKDIKPVFEPFATNIFFNWFRQ